MIDKKKYMIFSGIEFYPKGGIKDFYGYISNLDDIEKEIEDSDEDFHWCHIVDSKNLEIVKIGMEYEFYSDRKNHSKWKWETIKNEV